MLEFGQGMKIIPLGGLESIGMNITAFEYKNSIVVVDCGLAFPTDDMPGIDMVIPDVDYLERNIDKVEAFVITHGHEDHIGALPYVLRRVNVPIYATRLTMALIEKKLEEHEMTELVERHIVAYGDVLKLGEFKVEIIRTNHSIADSAALAITTKVGTIVHSGDFKIDYTPVFGDIADLQRFGELGKKGVLALLCDSTNAIRPGFTMSEKTERQPPYHRCDVCFQCGPCTADHQYSLSFRPQGRDRRPQHGERYRHGVGAGIHQHPGRHPDRSGRNEKLPGGEDGAHHHGQPGRVHGSSVAYGLLHPPQGLHYAGRPDHLQFTPHSGQ